MPTIVHEAVKLLSRSINLSTGLNHPSDMNKARDLFRILHENGEILTKAEIENAALAQHWDSASADELGSIGQQIGEGKKPRIADGPWWAVDIYEQICQCAASS